MCKLNQLLKAKEPANKFNVHVPGYWRLLCVWRLLTFERFYLHFQGNVKESLSKDAVF